MANNHGGKRDNRKKKADDGRGGRRTPGPGKTLGRPRKDTRMTTTMYLSNDKEIAAAARAAKELGYKDVTKQYIRANDLRYVANLVSREEGMDLAAQRALEAAIVEQVGWVRNENT